MSSELSRRTLLKVLGGAGASLALGCFPVSARARGEKGAAFQPNAFVKVDPDGTITVTVSKSDMGQGIRTTFAMLVAEEMDADWTKVRVEQAVTNSAVYGGHGTGGSGSTRGMNEKLRQMGAGARLMLVAAAAQNWGVDPSTCRTENGRVLHPGSNRSVPYQDLTALAATMPVPSDIKLKDPAEYRIIGKAKSRIDNVGVVTGRAIYGLDTSLPNVAFAVVSRRPAFGASVASFDDTAARKVAGVIDVVQIPTGVAVVGSDTWAALKGREALKVTWDLGPNTELDNARVRESLRAAVKPHIEMPAGARVVEATVDLPYLAHATMEPQCAIADVREDGCTIWAPNQSPDGAQGQVARALGLAPEKVIVNVTLLGGGFGRRFTPDSILEAVQISKAAKRPIKLLWTRDDDMRNDFYRPASHHALKGAVDASGNAVGWSHQAILAQSGGRGGGGFGNAGIPYDIPNSGFLRGGAAQPIPTGPWRSVEHSQTNVVNEMFIDEMAVAAGQDPFEFRRRLIRNDRLRKVLETAAEKAGWGRPLPKGSGRGIACFMGYGSFAAHVVELSVKGNDIRVDRAVCAVDCGLAINPSGVEAQMQGAFVDGLSTALKAEINIDKGGVVESSFVDYEWARMDEMPKIETHIVNGGGPFGGMGEVGYPSSPAAIANAVFAATGKRVRRFPIRVEELA